MIARFIAVCCCGFAASGCMGWLVGDPHPYAYVLRKGDADAIGRWTAEQTDARKLYDGMCALCVKADATQDGIEAEKATRWAATNLRRIEDWPPDQVLPASNGGRWTTARLVEEALSSFAHDAYDDRCLVALLVRVRPDGNHARWLGVWDKTMEDLNKSWREREDRQVPR